MRVLRAIAFGLIIVIVLVVVGVSLWVGDQYRRLIYPGVAVTASSADPEMMSTTVDVGGLSRSAAKDRLVSRLPTPEDQILRIGLNDQAWKMTWAMVDQSYDIDAAVDAAYRAQRDRAWWLAILAVLRSESHVVEAPLKPAEADAVRAHVEMIAQEIATTPQDATIAIAGGEVVVTPAQDGQVLDVETATAKVLAALAEGQDDVILQAEAIPARVTTTEPARSQALAILSAPLTLDVHDPLTGDLENGGYRATFTAQPSQISQWLSFVERQDQYHLNISPTGILAWVEDIAPQVTGEPTGQDLEGEDSPEQPGQIRSIDVYATTARIGEALRAAAVSGAAGSPVQAVVRHPSHTYIVQPGDVFYDIAFSFGFPQWQLELANPEVDPSLIDVGQELTIPSIDVLFPHPLVPDKRIEVDLPTQTLRAYEDDTQIFEFKVSTGISRTPTLAGQFQILFKEDVAFAQRWSLDMPYFMGFYEEGEDFYNGFHELPITSYGTRLSAGVLGYPASFGCIILDVGDAEALYKWADVGTLVRVYGVAPGTPFGQQTLDDIAPLTGTGESEP
ncbi:MAG: peptidoglycan binding domain-containing protein [Anaerolineae bacterium]|nr:peptidoglycan binding domain-containing protein [Anaerolineae bacterium]